MERCDRQGRVWGVPSGRRWKRHVRYRASLRDTLIRCPTALRSVVNPGHWRVRSMKRQLSRWAPCRTFRGRLRRERRVPIVCGLVCVEKKLKGQPRVGSIGRRL